MSIVVIDILFIWKESQPDSLHHKLLKVNFLKSYV